jgi:WD40 repeat protein
MERENPVDKTNLFLSYARTEDEPFVKRLYEDLTAQGFVVWWDRVAMPSRALSFLQEIRDAIDRAGRLVLVVYEKSLTSPYVRAEWLYALEACLGVLPVLRQADKDFSLLPPELANLHCVDMRPSRPYGEALAELLGKLGQPVPRLGPLRGNVPTLPPHFVPRPAAVASLRAALLADVERPVVISAARRTAAVHGMGGIGKTVLAAAFVRDCAARRAFTDGIVWITLGQTPDLLAAMRDVGMACGDSPTYYVDVTSAQTRLPQLLNNVTLVVLDDVWELPHAQMFLNALGPRARLLITTRDAGLALALGAAAQELELLGDDAARQLLADWADQPASALPSEALAVIQECGNLPLAISMAGAMARGIEGVPWSDLLDALRAADLSFLQEQLPNYLYPDLLRSLKVSVERLAQAEPAAAQRYQELAVFPAAVAVPEAAVLTLWAHTGMLPERNARRLLTTLANKALLRLEGNAPQRRIVLHDLQHDYMRAMAGDLKSLHGALLDAYAVRCSGSWAGGPNDGYFFQFLVYHLSGSGREQELRTTLLDYRWLCAKLAALSANNIVGDYDYLPQDGVLRTVQAALRLAARILAQHPEQLAPQLLGRLLGYATPEIQPLLEAATPVPPGPWLRPLTATAPTSVALLRYLPGHRSWASGARILPDGERQARPQRAISAAHDGTLKVWDLETGLELRTLAGHAGPVLDVAATGDSRLAVSAAADKTLKVWDVAVGTVVSTLVGHRAPVTCVAVGGPAGLELAVSGSADTTLRVWSLADGECLHVMAGHAGTISGVAVTPDGSLAVSASNDRTVRIWESREGRLLHRLEGHTREVTAVAIAADARLILSVAKDRTFRVWNLDTGGFLHDFNYLWEGVRAVDMTPDGKIAVSASDFLIRLWDVATGKEVRHLHGHNQYVTDVAVTPDGRFILSASRDARLGLWDLRMSDPPTPPGKHRGPVRALAITPDGQLAVSGASDSTVHLWDMGGRTFVCPLQGRAGHPGHSGRVRALAVLPGSAGQRVLSGGGDGGLILWDLGTRRAQRLAGKHGGGVLGLAIRVGTPEVFSIAADGTVGVWDLAARELRRTFAIQKAWTNEDQVSAIAVATHGRFLVCSLIGGELEVWDIEQEHRLRQLTGHKDCVSGVAFLPDDRSVVSAGYDGTLRVWDTANGACLQVIKAHADWIRSMALLPGAGHVVTASSDGAVGVWNLGTGQVVARLDFDGSPQAVAVAPDGVTLAVGDNFGRVYFVRLESA